MSLAVVGVVVDVAVVVVVIIFPPYPPHISFSLGRSVPVHVDSRPCESLLRCLPSQPPAPSSPIFQRAAHSWLDERLAQGTLLRYLRDRWRRPKERRPRGRQSRSRSGASIFIAQAAVSGRSTAHSHIRWRTSASPTVSTARPARRRIRWCSAATSTGTGGAAMIANSRTATGRWANLRKAVLGAGLRTSRSQNQRQQPQRSSRKRSHEPVGGQLLFQTAVVF